MRLYRSYSLLGDVLSCKAEVMRDPVAEESENEFHSIYETVGEIYLSMVVGPDARRKTDFVVKSSGCSRSLLLAEIFRFCSIVKQMYEL